MPRYDSYSPAVHVPVPADPTIAALAGTYQRWNAATLTYSFPMAGAQWASGYPSSYASQPPHVNATGLTVANQDQVRYAMSKWSELINMPIVEVADGVEVGDLRLAYYGTDVQFQGFAWYPTSAPWGGDIWLSPSTAGYRPGIEPGWPHPLQLMLHEIGHALGLTHPWEGGARLPSGMDDLRYTVMSYTGEYNFEPTTPMLLDILAIQHLYGANHATRAGNDTYLYDDSRIFHETIWDGGGIDTLQYVGARNALINLNAGESSRVGQELRSSLSGRNDVYDNIWIAYNVLIENARGGSGHDRLAGNASANRLEGGEGDDHLAGRGGDDVLVGGAGADVFEFGLWGNGEDAIEDFAAGDRIRIDGAQLTGAAFAGTGATAGRFEVQCREEGGFTVLCIGTDAQPGADVTIRLAGSFAPPRFHLDGQFITLRTGETRVGTPGADRLTGTPGDDLIDGGAGLDTLTFTGASTAYSVQRNASGARVSGPEGTDTLAAIERLRLADNMGIALDVEGNAGQAYRLYQAAFDRAPDLPGLGYQINDLDQGWALPWVAGNFIASPEFQSRYGGAVDDRAFVTLLYRNVLDREPEAAGLEYHVDRLARGAERADILVGFSESPENQANVIGQIAHGMPYVPFA